MHDCSAMLLHRIRPAKPNQVKIDAFKAAENSRGENMRVLVADTESCGEV